MCCDGMSLDCENEQLLGHANSSSHLSPYGFYDIFLHLVHFFSHFPQDFLLQSFHLFSRCSPTCVAVDGAPVRDGAETSPGAGSGVRHLGRLGPGFPVLAVSGRSGGA